MNNRFVVTGGPGGGKTTILTALAERGYNFAPESARRIIKERLAAGLSPRPDPVPFAHEILTEVSHFFNAGCRGSTSALEILYN